MVESLIDPENKAGVPISGWILEWTSGFDAAAATERQPDRVLRGLDRQAVISGTDFTKLHLGRELFRINFQPQNFGQLSTKNNMPM
jgi:hypothetical protein